MADGAVLADQLDDTLEEHAEPDPADEYERLQLEHDALTLKPGERRKLSARAERIERTEAAKAAAANIVLRFRDDDRAMFQRLLKFWAFAETNARKAQPDGGVAPDVRDYWDRRMNRQAERSTLKRFEGFAVEPERVVPLREDHKALADARTIFPKTVTPAWQSERLLVSGHNNAKLGAKVEKGPWAGMPLYQLTLEERASCPKSCPQWRGCYGNAMHLARRHDHWSDNFLDFLRAELWLAAREHQKSGFVVRLHTLGDFFSVEYVEFWREMLDALPMLRVFGYTANHPDAENAEEAAIGRAISELAGSRWYQFAIRFSNSRGPQGAVVLDAPEEADGAILCPAQHQADTEAKTAACSTCGLCWSPEARPKTIAFLRHGMKRAARVTESETA